MADINQFEELWGNFVLSFKGELITQSKQLTLSFPLVKLIFTDKVLSLTSEYNMFGRWLGQLTQENPIKGALIKDILTKDMTLTEETMTKEIPLVSKYVVTGSAGAVGYIAAKVLDMGMLGSAILTIAPMVVSYPAVSTYISARKRKDVDDLIDAYVAQLEKYKKSVCSVLLTEI